MPEYTTNPVPVFEGRQINTQEDADAWVASLTDNELRNEHDSVFFSDVRIEIEQGEFALKFTRTDNVDGVMPINMVMPLGGYAMAIKVGNGINLWTESETEFARRFQPYAQ